MKTRVTVIIAAVLLSAFAMKGDVAMWRARSPMEKDHAGCLSGVSAAPETLFTRNDAIINIYVAWKDVFPRKYADRARARKKILMLTWEPYEGELYGVSILGGIASGDYDALIKKMAVSCRAHSVPMLLRWGHEMNGNWYSWSGEKNSASAENYRAAFRRVRGIFAREGADNVKFIFSVNNEDVPAESWNRFEKYYPGDEYADAIGIDAYDWGAGGRGTRGSGTEIVRRAYERAVRLSPAKPVMLTEVSTCASGTDKATWLSDFFTGLEKRFPAVKAFVWFDYDKECDWRLGATDGARDIYERALSSGYFSREAEKLDWFFSGGENGGI